MAHLLRCVLFCLVLSLTWVIFSGRATEPFFLLTGLASVAITLWLSLRLKIVDEEAQPIRISLRFPFYSLWLLTEMLRSSLRVAYLCIAQKPKLSPTFRWIKSDGNHVGHAIYANSITLTPGTVTLDVHEHADGPADIYVHALEADSFTSLEEGTAHRKMQWLIGKHT